MTTKWKFAEDLAELMAEYMQAGMHTSEMIPALEKELAFCRQPYQDEPDGDDYADRAEWKARR